MKQRPPPACRTRSPSAAVCSPLFFNPEPVTSYAISAKNDTEQFSKYFHRMLERGVYLPCSQFEANFVSMKHTAEDIEQSVAAAREVLGELSVEC